MATISTHILDTSRGAPASGVAVCLEAQNTDESWAELSHEPQYRGFGIVFRTLYFVLRTLFFVLCT